ncbi:hypothetical protein [Pseudomonas sp. AN-1]|uniref:hypothetical protein n=1 Tax=Pseudomonas sp. AN-1 TaxID=3096605 RepID=UPI002A6B5412|nr:hypothetical protein [Pseudomonas sp. AN-1]WPP46278.1 hypothetical protein SK095_02515 [Pseudomonas sp. AN-1]
MKEWILIFTLSAGTEQPPQQALISGFQSQEKCISAASKIGTHAVSDRKKMLEELKQPLESPPEPLVRFTCTEIDK